jgi:hypothetical protein
VYYFVDPVRDYVVMRTRNEYKGSAQQQIDISYVPSDVCGWVPSSWKDQDYSSDGALIGESEKHILSLKLNEEQDAEQFELEFPPGTRLSDTGTGRYYQVQPNGDMLERAPNWDELPGGQVLSQGGRSWLIRHKWTLIAAGVVVLVAFAAFYGVRRKGRAA